MPKFCQVIISATSQKEANAISDTIVKKRLVAGSLILKGPSRYWWKGKIAEKEYYNIQAFSLLKNKQKIVSTVKKIHSDECPIIAFFHMDGNPDFLNWIAESVKWLVMALLQITLSVLNADFSRIDEWLPQFEQAQADAVHWDIMDNEFVPAAGVNWNWILELRPKTKLPFDCHLMVKEPELYVGKMIQMGADSITVHAEATENPQKALEQIQGAGLKADIAIHAQTPAEKILSFLAEADLAPIMGVQTGFGGQQFLPTALEKILMLKKTIEKKGLNCKIQVNGGINLKTGKQCVQAGADILVAGFFVFKYRSVTEAIFELKRLWKQNSS